MSRPRVPFLAATVVLTLALAPLTARAATLRVGPDKPYRTVRAASLAAQNGDTVEVDAGVYSADVTSWHQNDITVRGVGGGRAHMRADGAQEGDKGTWVLYGRNFTAENIEFSGASVPDMNGAGIRSDGAGLLVVRNCYFHDNENGILGGSGDEVLIEYSIFDHNGFGDGQSHNMYISDVTKFTLRYSYSHRANIGHNVKSRAHENWILYNRIMDESDGTASYEIDLAQGGRSYLIGNVIEQGPNTDNSSIVAYATENTSSGAQDLYVVNNTFVNNRSAGGLYLQLRTGTTARVVNNIFYGPGTLWSSGSTVTAATNYIRTTRDNAAGFADPAGYDFHLTASSPTGTSGIVDAGSNPGMSSTGVSLTPMLQYVYDLQSEARPVVGALDIGAFERGGAVSPPPAPTGLTAR
jgi:parallel beta helix pectate lyase-like protein